MTTIYEVTNAIETNVFCRKMSPSKSQKSLCALTDTFNLGSENEVIKFAWFVPRGLGAVGIEKLSDLEQEAAQALFKEGKIVPTEKLPPVRGDRALDVEHFDHLDWAETQTGELVFIDELAEKYLGKPDTVGHISDIHHHAAKALRHKLKREEAWRLSPFELVSSEVVTPITTNKNLYLMDQRRFNAEF